MFGVMLGFGTKVPAQKVYATDTYVAGSELKIETGSNETTPSTTFAGGKYLHLYPIDKNYYSNSVSANADMEYDETTGVLKIFETDNTADEAPNGYVFDKWTSTNEIAFADEHSATTTFTMPAKSVTITATYKLAVAPETQGGISAGAVVGIVLASLVVCSLGGLAVYYFVIKKKTWADFVKATKNAWNKFINLFKKKK